MVIAVITACTKDDDTSSFKVNKSTLSVLLTDNPADADAVNVEIIGLSVHIAPADTDSVSKGGWHVLNVNAGIYDLLELQDTTYEIVKDTLLPSGKITQLRFYLGNDNTIVIYGDTLSMQTPGTQQSGLKIQINENFVDGNTYDLVIDFDAGKSVVQTGNGEYILKPVIKKESFTER